MRSYLLLAILMAFSNVVITNNKGEGFLCVRKFIQELLLGPEGDKAYF